MLSEGLEEVGKLLLDEQNRPSGPACLGDHLHLLLQYLITSVLSKANRLLLSLGQSLCCLLLGRCLQGDTGLIFELLKFNKLFLDIPFPPVQRLRNGTVCLESALLDLSGALPPKNLQLLSGGKNLLVGLTPGNFHTPL